MSATALLEEIKRKVLELERCNVSIGAFSPHCKPDLGMWKRQRDQRDSIRTQLDTLLGQVVDTPEAIYQRELAAARADKEEVINQYKGLLAAYNDLIEESGVLQG